MIKYLAHSPTAATPDGQLLKDHLERVSALAGDFAKPFGERDGQLCGLYHDIGKYSEAFQKRLTGNSMKVDHSTAGALLLFEHKNVPAAMCIAGHHAGLADCGTRNDLSDSFMARIRHAKAGGIEDFDAWRDELPDNIPDGCVSRPDIGNYFYTKMLFSALTDADWLDTEAYFENSSARAETSADIRQLVERLSKYISPWQNPENEINRRRCMILNSAIEHGEDPRGLFAMTVPTGGGKTVSSMAFALHHALKYGLGRVIYVIPYCSILEQTQSIFEEIFGKEVVTAHYSGADFERNEDAQDTSAFSVENWEAPIILTTAVQFFESMYSNKPGKNRKLHNIVNSVVVFDEAQMLPIPYLRPCLAGICKLVEDYGCSAVLCTATQPAVAEMLREYLPGRTIRELCPEPEKMYQAFRRVSYADEGTLTDEMLAERLRERKQVLCVVNSRRQAQQLFRALAQEPGTYHLSTMMIPHDRRLVLKEIRDRLHTALPCRVISTSLIEAGVDVDFPEVYRAIAGLDSIIQSGGRCNREGKRSRGASRVHIFRTDSKAPRMLEQNISAAEHVLRQFAEVDSPEAVHEYFQFLLYTLRGDSQLDEKEILSCAKKLMFETVAERFHLIDGAGYTVYIPVDEGAALLQELRWRGPTRKLMRRLDRYAVNVYRQYYDELRKNGALEQISECTGILTDPELYSRETGLPFELSEQNEVLFI